MAVVEINEPTCDIVRHNYRYGYLCCFCGAGLDHRSLYGVFYYPSEDGYDGQMRTAVGCACRPCWVGNERIYLYRLACNFVPKGA